MEAEIAELAVYLLHLEFLPTPLKAGKCSTFNQLDTRNADGDHVEQILIGQLLESGKWALKPTSVNNTRAAFPKKGFLRVKSGLL